VTSLTAAIEALDPESPLMSPRGVEYVIMKFNKNRNGIKTVKTGHSDFVREIYTKHIQYTFRYFINKFTRNIFTKNILKNSNSKTGHSGLVNRTL
jgi:hypothetical protein